MIDNSLRAVVETCRELSERLAWLAPLLADRRLPDYVPQAHRG